MPAGALFQLNNPGSQDLLLTGNPRLTFFSRAYKTYTNFATETIPLTPRWNGQSDTRDTLLTCKIDKHGDALKDLWLDFDLPDIWSPIAVDASGGLHPYEFKWIENIGFNTILSAALHINGIEIEKVSGEWMKLYNEKHCTDEKKRAFDEMTGNVPDVFDPAVAFGRQGSYPHATRDVGSGNIEPSIRGRTLSVPILFSFTRDPGQCLRLLLLGASEVEVKITLRPTYDLWTIREVRADISDTGLRIRANNAIAQHQLQNFLVQPLPLTGTPSILGVQWRWNPSILATFISLGADEREEWARSSRHTQIYKEVREFKFESLFGNAALPLELNNLVTDITWTLNRSDTKNYNGWDNYTNWNDSAIKPNIWPPGYADENKWSSTGLLLDNGIRDILISANISLEGRERMGNIGSNYFQWQQLSAYRSSPRLRGIYNYSFQLNNSEYQPSGALNGSKLNKCRLNLTMQDPPTTGSSAVLLPGNTIFFEQKDGINGIGVTQGVRISCAPISTNPARNNIPIVVKDQSIFYAYTYECRVFVESYNFLTYMNGTAGPQFAK